MVKAQSRAVRQDAPNPAPLPAWLSDFFWHLCNSSLPSLRAHDVPSALQAVSIQMNWRVMEEVFTVSLLGIRLKQNGVRLNHVIYFPESRLD